MLSSSGVLDSNKYRLVFMRLCIQYIFIHEDLTRSAVVDDTLYLPAVDATS